MRAKRMVLVLSVLMMLIASSSFVSAGAVVTVNPSGDTRGTANIDWTISSTESLTWVYAETDWVDGYFDSQSWPANWSSVEYGQIQRRGLSPGTHSFYFSAKYTTFRMYDYATPPVFKNVYIPSDVIITTTPEKK